jgi:phosphate transport system protein
MNRHHFDEEIEKLEHDVLDMASRAERMVGRAVDALQRLDLSLAREVLLADDEIDQLDLDIEAQCLRLLALQQPMARDLRIVGTAMKIITDIERIGDLAVDVAKIAMKVEAEGGDPSLIDLPKISKVARQMLQASLDAYVKKDVSKLEEIARMEDETDTLYRDLRGQVHNYMRTHPDQVVSASWLLLAVHHVERIADHALNIAERVGFMVTGELEQISASHRSDHHA